MIPGIDRSAQTLLVLNDQDILNFIQWAIFETSTALLINQYISIERRD